MAKAWFFDRSIRVDVGRGVLSIVPSRWAALAIVPCFASTAAVLFWIQSGGAYRLKAGGWLIAVGHAALTLFLAGIFMSPRNRRVTVHFRERTFKIAAAYGLGRGLSSSFDDASFRYEQDERTNQGRTTITGKVIASVGIDSYTLLATANDAVRVAVSVAETLEMARHGDPDLHGLEASVEHLGRGSLGKFGVMLLIMLAPAATLAFLYGRG